MFKVLFIEWKLLTIGKKNEISQKKLRKWKLSPASEKVTGNTDIDLPPTSNSSVLKIITLISSAFRLDGRFVCFYIDLRLDSFEITFAVFFVFSRKIFQSEQKRSSYRLQPGAKEEMINKNIFIYWNKEFRILVFFILDADGQKH